LDTLKNYKNMVKTYKTQPKKKMVEVPVCQECLDPKKDKKLYFWVDKETHYFLCCIDCIAEFGYEIAKPYHETKRKSKKDI